ncbi:MAG: hypothetical protein COA96_12875 [SAR86 cluster bacterium]|uniref:DUF4404 family protein n=1 Tax=SAR86 cluster bacterium TaxID=2030880 RepID=A0A2A5AUT5_9GAMM|nr:MAG: hypothetical protein COA96_12875 [SAR86 cluster bacterium]
MTEQRVKELISELLAELKQTEGVNEDMVSTVNRLESDINDLVNPEIDTQENTVMDDVIALEAIFTANHPVAEKIIRELINSLSRIGI